jgi:hypothetical protein
VATAYSPLPPPITAAYINPVHSLCKNVFQCSCEKTVYTLEAHSLKSTVTLQSQGANDIQYQESVNVGTQYGEKASCHQVLPTVSCFTTNLSHLSVTNKSLLFHRTDFRVVQTI